MGNKHSQKTIRRPTKAHLLTLRAETTCPLCGKIFDTSKTVQQLNDHLTICGTNFLKDKSHCPIYLPKDDQKINKTILKNAKDYKISKLSLQEKSKIDLDTKIKDLKVFINSKKISWEKGCCTMEISRNDLLKDSMEKIEKVNLQKELKITFKGEEGLDAGGLFREWFNICF